MLSKMQIAVKQTEKLLLSAAGNPIIEGLFIAGNSPFSHF